MLNSSYPDVRQTRTAKTLRRRGQAQRAARGSAGPQLVAGRARATLRRLQPGRPRARLQTEYARLTQTTKSSPGSTPSTAARSSPRSTAVSRAESPSSPSSETTLQTSSPPSLTRKSVEPSSRRTDASPPTKSRASCSWPSSRSSANVPQADPDHTGSPLRLRKLPHLRYIVHTGFYAIPGTFKFKVPAAHPGPPALRQQQLPHLQAPLARRRSRLRVRSETLLALRPRSHRSLRRRPAAAQHRLARRPQLPRRLREDRPRSSAPQQVLHPPERRPRRPGHPQTHPRHRGAARRESRRTRPRPAARAGTHRVHHHL